MKEGKKERGRRKVSKERSVVDLECGPAQPSLFIIMVDQVDCGGKISL